ncbi:MAG: TetR/AcrR family transcriptional regulator [Deltaproteobacteria bacterium]|nr:TetR/AcrR family transcriptional regulator [Deltaproteobacteria bacterium]
MPRKPIQKRSKATVEAIIEAGFVCVARHGPSDTTTRQIADVAGISVGSLYEYFRDKEDIFVAMNRKFSDDVVVLIRELTPEVVKLEIREAIRLLVARFGQFLTRNDGRYLSIARQLIRAEPLDSIEPVSKALMDLLVQYLSNHPEYMKIRNIPTMAYILVNAGIFVVLRQLTSENPPVTYEQVGEGLAYLVSYYVDREIAQGS